MEKTRIQKVLAAAGVASRRAVEEMITEGRVAVNGRTITDLPCFVTSSDRIVVDGRVIRARSVPPVYILLNKPRGVVCTSRDEPGRHRPTAVDLVGGIRQRVYCVGRLDEDSTGLIILTNDGDLTHRLTHPSFGVPKTYVVHVAGRLEPADMEALRRGVFVGSSRTKGAQVKLVHRGAEESVVQLRVSEGRNRQVRRMLLALGHKVRRLHRSRIGPLGDRGLKIGSFRSLTGPEVAALRKAAGMESGE